MRSLVLERMTTSTPQAKPAPETHLQRTLNAALNDLGTDSVLAAIFHQENGPLVEHASRDSPKGCSSDPSHPVESSGLCFNDDRARSRKRAHGSPAVDHPGAKSLLAVPLRHLNRVYGCLVIGRREGAAFSKRRSRSSNKCATA